MEIRTNLIMTTEQQGIELSSEKMKYNNFNPNTFIQKLVNPQAVKVLVEARITVSEGKKKKRVYLP